MEDLIYQSTFIVPLERILIETDESTFENIYFLYGGMHSEPSAVSSVGKELAKIRSLEELQSVLFR